MSLSKKIEKNFPEGISMPLEISMMLDYINDNESESQYFQIDIQFQPINKEIIKYYFNNEELETYFGLLGTTADGSILAIWKDNEEQRFVHFGSDGSNWLILAPNPIDFIRLIAIGYDNFDKNEILNPPQNSRIDKLFQSWVENIFSVEIPQSGKDIVDLNSEQLINWIES
jgi:hypothetical protein